ncbi:MAG: Gfo/Idh/MocA family oxidoreductase [Pirellulales bacterium]|nr:Gfo/Idh/MocA family oxidoreductase [Pirellulales bacterium]
MGGKFDRRGFLAQLGSAAASAGYLLSSETARGYQANDTLNIGCIGVGGRCRHLLKALVKIPDVRVAAVCDIWQENLEIARKLADPQALVTGDHRAVLDRADLDAVLIATPDHWHSPLTIEACAAGKDVYVEKPLTHALDEGPAVIAAQNRHQRVVQVGMQQRSMPHMQAARELIRAGTLGEIHKVHLTWNRNQPRAQAGVQPVDASTVDWKRFLGSAPEQPFEPYRFRNWRWFWDFGGGLFTDLMTHQIDIANWVLDLGEPATAAAIGDHVNDGGRWETPDTVQTLVHYPSRQTQVYFEGTFSSARNAAMIEFMGTEGTLYLDRGRYELIPERRSKLEPREMVLGTGPRGADFYDQPDGELLHLTNWIECIRSRQQPTAPVEAGVAAVWGPHLANLALRSASVAKWPA